MITRNKEKNQILPQNKNSSVSNKTIETISSSTSSIIEKRKNNQIFNKGSPLSLSIYINELYEHKLNTLKQSSKLLQNQLKVLKNKSWAQKLRSIKHKARIFSLKNRF